jgi:hypothetical protein
MLIDVNIPDGIFIVDEVYMEYRPMHAHVTVKGHLYPTFEKPTPEHEDLVTTYSREMEE